MLFTKYRKLILSLLGIYLLLKLLLWRPVFDAIVGFCFGGIVPGTDMVIAADTVLWTLLSLVLFGLVAALAFVRMRTYRTTRQLGMALLRTDSRGANQATQTAATSDSPDSSRAYVSASDVVPLAGVSAVSNAVQSPLERHEDRPGVLSVIAELLRLIAANLQAQSLIAAKRFERYYRYSMGFARALISRGLVLLLTAVAFMAVVFETGASWVMALLRRAAKYGSMQAGASWAWAEPRLNRLDAWLELQTKSAARNMLRWAARSDNLIFMAATFRSYFRAGVPYVATAWITLKAQADKIRSLF